MTSEGRNLPLDDLVKDLAATKSGQPAEHNIFRALGITRDEVRQSAFVAWLLAKNSPHRAGQSILAALVRDAGSEYRVGDSPYTVTREYAGSESQIDVVVSAPGPPSLIVYVENKVDAVEGDGQLDAENRDLDRLRRDLLPGAEVVKIFLTPRGTAGSTGDGWHPLSYERLGSIVESCEIDMPEPWRSIVHQWREALPLKTSPKAWRAIDRATYEAIRSELGALCEAVADGMSQRYRQPPWVLNPFQKAPGQIHFTNREPGLDGVCVGVDRMWPEGLLAGAPGTAPRLWVWHETDDPNLHQRLEDAVRRHGATEAGGLLPVSRDSRRRQYVALKWIGQYRMGEPSYSERLYREIRGFFSDWLPIIEAVANSGEAR